jgi:hypothetical protein
MTQGAVPHNRFRLGFLVRHQSVWLSELLANMAVLALLIVLMSITLMIFLNARAVRLHDRQITALRAEKIAAEHTAETMKRELLVLSLLRELAGARIADHTLCQVARLVCLNSGQFGYDPLLLLAVIQVEGVFDPQALGRFRSGTPSGALGLMQLQLETAREVAHLLAMPDISKKDLLKPEINLLLGAAYLTQLITLFHDFRLGLIAYNQGPVAVLHTLSNRRPLSNEYYQMVLRSYYWLKKHAAQLSAPLP